MTTIAKAEFKAPSDMAEISHQLAPVPEAMLVGTWNNIDHATRGLVKVVIANAGAGISVDAYGACSPTPCNWGVVAATSYAANVSSTAAVAFSTQYNFGFKQTIITGHLEAKLLVVETFDVFTDGSFRSSYYSKYEMSK